MCSGEMRRDVEEYRWRRRPSVISKTDACGCAKERGEANRIRYPGSPRFVNDVGLEGRGLEPWLLVAPTLLNRPPGEYGRFQARLKLKMN